MDFNKILNNQKAINALDRNDWPKFFRQVNSLEDLSMQDFYDLFKFLLSEAADEICDWINKLKPVKLTPTSVIFNKDSWSHGFQIVNKNFCYKFKWLTFLYWALLSDKLSFYERDNGNYIYHESSEDRYKLILGFYDKNLDVTGYGKFHTAELYGSLPFDDWDHQIVYKLYLSQSYTYRAPSQLFSGERTLLNNTIDEINAHVTYLINELIEKINEIKNENK